MGQIDLGERPTEPLVEERPLARTWLGTRWMRLGVVLVVLFTTMAGAGTGSARISAATIPARLGVSVVVDDDRIFVIDPVDTTSEPRQQVGAYRLPDGEPLWRVRMPVPGPLGGYTLVGETLVLTSDWGSVAPRRTVGVDTANGAVAWLRTAALDAVTGYGDVLLWIPDADVTGAGPDDVPDGWGTREPGTLQAVAPDTGQVRWSLELSAGSMRGYPDPPDTGSFGSSEGLRPKTVMVQLPGGLIEVRDLADGRLLRSTELPRKPATGQWSLAVVGDLLLVPEGPLALTAYGLDRFERQWTIDWDVDRELWPQPCGDLLCTYLPQGGVRVLDRDTGVRRWADERWSGLMTFGPYLIASHEGRPMLPAGLAVLDPPTGRVLGDLGVWQVLGALPGGGSPVDAGTPAGGGSAGAGRLLGVRPSLDGRTWVAELDPAAVSVRRLAALPDISGDCQYAHRLLICRRLNGAIGIWRLPT